MNTCCIQYVIFSDLHKCFSYHATSLLLFCVTLLLQVCHILPFLTPIHWDLVKICLLFECLFSVLLYSGFCLRLTLLLCFYKFFSSSLLLIVNTSKKFLSLLSLNILMSFPFLKSILTQLSWNLWFLFHTGSFFYVASPYKCQGGHHSYISWNVE